MKNIFNYKKFILNEKLLNNLDFNEIVTKLYLELQEQSGRLNPYVSQYMHEEFGEFFDPDNDATDIINSTDFKNWLKYELESRFEDLYYDFETNVVDENGYVTLYRSMKVEDNYLELLKTCKVKRVGIYWTWNFNKAEPHWGYNDNNKQNDIIFETKIKEEYINWIDTFRLNLEHEYYNEENEIRLFKNTPLNITNIWWNNNQINIINDIKNCNFKS